MGPLAASTPLYRQQGEDEEEGNDYDDSRHLAGMLIT
jgi:hypothetical protein